jgi:TP901 family phage tail tape measure protein
MADDIRQNISVTADTSGLQVATKRLEDYAKRLREAATATRNLKNTSKGNPTQALNQGLQQTAKNAPQAAKGIKNVGNAATASAAQVAAMSKQLSRIGKIVGIQFLLRALFSVTSQLSESVEEFGKLERALAEIRTISGDTARSFEDMFQASSEISSALGIDRLELAEGAYQALSAQVVDAAGAFDFVKTAAELAVSTLATTKESVDALSSILNSYGASASLADDISGKLFKTIELGRIRMSQLSKVIGRVAPLAATLGVSLDETLANLATLTQTGVSAEEAGTLLSNVFLKLIKPTDELKKVFAELGVSSGETLIAQEGLAGALDLIAETGGRTSVAMGKLFGRIRAIRGILALTGKQSEEVNRVFAEINKAGAKDLEEALAEIQATEFQALQRNLQTLKNTLLDTFGGPLLSAANDAIEAFQGVSQAVEDLAPVISTLIGLTGKLLITQEVLWSGIAGLIEFATLQTKDFGTESEKVFKELEKAARKSGQQRAEAESQRASAYIQNILQAVERERRLNADVLEILRAQRDLIRDDLVGQIENKISGVERLVQSVRDAGIEAVAAFQKLPDLANEVNRELQDFEAEVRLEGLEGPELQRGLVTEALRKEREAFKLAAAGSEEEAKAALKSAQAYAQRARNIETTNSVLQLQRRLIRDQLPLQQKIAQANLAKANAGQEEAATLNKIKGELKLQLDTYKKLLKERQEASQITPERSTELDRDLQNQAEKITQNLQKAFESGLKLEGLDLASIEDALKISPQVFDPITGATGEFASVAEERFSDVTAQIKKQLVGIQGILVELGQRTNINLQLLGAEAIKDAVVEIKKEIKETQELAGEGFALGKIVDSRAGSIPQQIKKLQENTLSGLDVTGAILAGDPTEEQQEILGFVSAFNELKAAQERLQGALAQGDPQALQELASKAREFKESLEGFRDPGLVDPLLLNIKGLADAAGKLNNVDFQAAFKGFKDATEGVNETGRNLGNTIEVEVIEGSAAAGKGIDTNIGGALEAQTARVNDLAAAIAAAGSAASAAGAARFGGRIGYRAFGGRGLDRSLVAMDPNEFVMTSAATRKFFPQLSAANSGVTPQFKTQGGEVHNEIGNISVSVTESAAPRQTARQVVSEIKREMRRGTTFFRGN